jgi:hypothetical protein
MKKLFPLIASAVLAAQFLTAHAADPVRRAGGDKDVHGCIPSAGYQWCEMKQKCLRWWIEPCADQSASSSASHESITRKSIKSPVVDKHGCTMSSGEYWCVSKQKCMNFRKEFCPSPGMPLRSSSSKASVKLKVTAPAKKK